MDIVIEKTETEDKSIFANPDIAKSSYDDSAPLELMIMNLARPFKKLVFSKMPDIDDKIIFISVLDYQTRLAQGFMVLASLQAIYGKTIKLSEELVKMCDTPEHMVDPEWMEKRDKYCNIRLNRMLNEYIISPAKLGKYLMSFLNSSGCVIEISKVLIPDIYHCPRDTYRIKSTFVKGPEDVDSAWQEQIYLRESDFKKYIEKRCKFHGIEED